MFIIILLFGFVKVKLFIESITFEYHDDYCVTELYNCNTFVDFLQIQVYNNYRIDNKKEFLLWQRLP